MKRAVISLGMFVALAGCKKPPPPPDPPAELTTAAGEASGKHHRRGEEHAGPLHVTFPSGPRTLTGVLWLPSGGSAHHGVIYNHGSERDPGDVRALGRFYTGRGYVFFMPVRRGHGESPGTYIGDLQDQTPAKDRARVVVDELAAQVDDVVAGLAYLKTRSEVDPQRIAVTGCSYGGIETMLTASRQTGFRVAVDFAGASESWAGNEPLRARLIDAAAHATIPIFFLQAENDYNTTPSKALSAEMEKVNKPHQLKLYPPHGTTPAEGHGGFCARSPEIWGDDVLSFIEANLR